MHFERSSSFPGLGFARLEKIEDPHFDIIVSPHDGWLHYYIEPKQNLGKIACYGDRAHAGMVASKRPIHIAVLAGRWRLEIAPVEAGAICSTPRTHHVENDEFTIDPHNWYRLTLMTGHGMLRESHRKREDFLVDNMRPLNSPSLVKP